MCSLALLSACGASSASGGASGTVHLKLGDIMPFTGDLSSFGPPLDASATLRGELHQ